MAATVPARRALSDMSVNTPIGNTPQKSSKSGLEVCPESTSLSKTGGKLFGEIESKSQNELGVVANSAKRRRVDTEDGQRREFLVRIRGSNIPKACSNRRTVLTWRDTSNDSESVGLAIEFVWKYYSRHERHAEHGTHHS